ncbi:MAG: TIGR03560 family F420-dependent LLM class oxidoreductase [Candidatus Bathyarchaeota archaeon]|jgi:F420-dependent oxidoreductase-like protein
MTSLDFGIQIEPQFGFTYQDIRGIASEAEELGFESIWVSDHFFLTKENIGTNCLECHTVLSALARDTRILRLGPMVASQSYRNPALLANIASSLDEISGGRLYFGIGAGWKEVEYKAYGYPFPRAIVRIRQLQEVIEIAKRMWTQEKATYRGRYYRIEDALCYPHPVQKPHIPIWVGGTGDLTLKVAAKNADAVNFAWSQPPSFFKERLNVLRKHCKRFGRDYDEIRKSAGLMITMEETLEELESELENQNREMDTPYRRYLSRQPPNIVDTPEVVAYKIAEYAALGIDHFILRFNFGQEIEKMRLFADKVLNKI